MEKCSRFLSAAMLVLFALLFGLALLLGGCQPEHLSYSAAAGLAVVPVAVYALWQRRPGLSPTVWERLGRGRTQALLLLLCLGVNLAWVLFFRLEPRGDYAIFWATSEGLSAGGSGIDRSYLALFPHVLGYSTFLSLFLRLFGTGPLVAPVLNVCLTTISGFFLYRLTLRWRGENSAAIVLLCWALFPSKIFFNAMVLSEPYYTCLLLAALCLTAEIEARKPKLGEALFVGALAGLLLRMVRTSRPIAAIPIVALLIWLLLLRGERDRASRLRWSAYTAALLAVYLLTGPLWNQYAASVIGEQPASVPGYSIYAGLNPETMGIRSDEDAERLDQAIENANGSAEAAQREMLEEAKARLGSGQFPFGRLFLAKLRSFLGYDEGGAYYSRSGLRDRAYQLLALYSNIWYYAIGITALWGTWRLLRSGNRRTVRLAPLYAIGLTLAQLLAEVAARYHYSVIPMLLVLAAFSYTKPVKRAEADSEAQSGA